MIDVKHLKTIQALHQHGSVNQAAQALFMTQSALSHQIKQLEDSLGLKLFERKSSPLLLTPAGKLLLKTAQDILPQLEQAQISLQSLEKGEQGRLWIGVECHTCFEWLLPMVRTYQKEWQGVDVDILNSLVTSDQNALQNLIQQKLDVVITSDPIEHHQLNFHELFSYELVLVTALNHPLTQHAYLQPQDLADQTLIHYPVPLQKLDVFQHFLTPAGIQPAARRTTEITLMMLQQVESGRGVCVLPKWLLSTLSDYQHLPTIRLGEQGLWSRLYAATHQNQQHLAYLNAFVDQMIETMAQQPK